MTPVPTTADILTLLDQLDTCVADDLETQWLDFKPWQSAKDAMKVAIEYAVCFANAEGGDDCIWGGRSDPWLGPKAVHCGDWL